MDPRAMEPLGLALRAFQDGDAGTELTLRRDDGVESRVPAKHFFRDPRESSPTEKAAIENARGRVLDIGAGSGLHTLAYHDANRQAGRYIGEVRVQLELAGRTGPFCGWLHVDSQTLTERAAENGWGCEVLARNEGPDYLARLTRP